MSSAGRFFSMSLGTISRLSWLKLMSIGMPLKSKVMIGTLAVMILERFLTEGCS